MIKGKRIAVVGGTAGIGLALARRAVGLGADIILGARNKNRLDLVADELGVSRMTIDTMDEAAVKKFFDFCGEIDHLATPGCSVRAGGWKDTSTEDYLYTLKSKLVGQALCARAASIRQGGSIVFFSGILAKRPGPWPLLGSVNAAVEALGVGLAVELSPIRVNVVSPGLTMNTEAFSGMTEEQRNQMFSAAAEKFPVGRVGEPDDSADAAVFLMENSFMTGQVICVDGGATAL
ncbi:MAG: SDR family oxidoreductase [Terrimicrobiaceae bacterium]